MERSQTQKRSVRRSGSRSRKGMISDRTTLYTGTDEYRMFVTSQWCISNSLAQPELSQAVGSSPNGSSERNISEHNSQLPQNGPHLNLPSPGSHDELSALGPAFAIDAQSAYLLQVYERGIGPWMDVFDLNLTYQRELLDLVPSSPLLLNAICALAARQLSLIGPSWAWKPIAERYYGQGVHLLARLLNGNPETMELAIVATMLLGSYELMSSPGLDYQRHFTGAKTIVDALQVYKSSSRLARASFWIYARHEVGEALNLNSPTRHDPKLWPRLDPAQSEPHEDLYCNDVLRICAEIECLVFGPKTGGWKDVRDIGGAANTMSVDRLDIGFLDQVLGMKNSPRCPDDEAQVWLSKTAKEHITDQNSSLSSQEIRYRTSKTMISVYLSLCCIITLLLVFLRRVAVYFWDTKGLRKYPGLDAFSGFTNLSFILQARRAPDFRTKMLLEAHQSYPVIRLGPDSLSFSDIKAIKDIYGHSTPCIKGDMYSTPGGVHHNVLDSVDKLEHSQKRKRLAIAFSAKHLEAWEFKVVDKCTRLISQFDKYSTSSSSADLRLWTNLFTVEAIADIALSQKLGLLEAGHDMVECEDVNGHVRQVSFLSSIRGVGRAQVPVIWSHNGYNFLKKVLSFFSRGFTEQIAHETAFGGIVRRLVSKRLEQRRLGDTLDDFCTSLEEDRKGNKTALHRAEIEAECNAFMNAGSDTTAIQLTHVLYYLLKNPNKMQKLRDELDAHISSDVVVPPYADVRTLPYLKACLDESLRLSPPVATGLQRKTPPEGMYINNEWIAGNTLVSLPAYIAHRDETAFPNSEEFLPERWLSDDAKGVQKYFIPFSAGSRGCIGRNITYLEQHVLIAALVRRFDFAFADPHWEMQWEEQYNLWPGTMPVIIKQRLT
ncbi:hypothetical protein FE257_004128 [Aspergillus nanangensis]|uniref:Cytochrome P450 n=1 Tax=Aspergillus nanangensis TaxID=2582783 RepID=A0AAD4CAW8_ASPNN|nr:hypothetical protein FE257_004128 [Aspergillus nanangensis]